MKKEKIMKIIIFIVVLLIPIIYSFFYLKSYWNPYGDLSGINLAVVNLDEGDNGENQGKEFVKELKNSGTFNICEVTFEESIKGMQEGNYYATITIPSNFTKCLNSASTSNKQIATITYSPNQATNYLATQIINSGMKTIEISLKTKIDSKIVGTLSKKLQEVPNSLNKISDGAEEILEGSQNLNNGLKQINDGTSKLNESYTEFDNGVNSAYEGSKSLDNGITKVNSGVGTLSDGAKSLDTAIFQINEGIEELSEKGNKGIETLGKGINELNQGTNNLNQGVSAYVNGTNQLANGAIQYVDGTTNLLTNVENYINNVDTVNGGVNQLLNSIIQYSNVSNDSTIKAMAQNAQKIISTNEQITNAGKQIKSGMAQITSSNSTINTGAKQLLQSGDSIKNGANELYNGTQKLVQGTNGLTAITGGVSNLKSALLKVKDGTQTLKTGVNTLSTGTKSLKLGSNDLNNGLNKLNNSSKEVKSALNTLNNGTNSAYQGSIQLVNGVETFNTEIKNGIEETNKELKNLEGIEEFAKSPVEFKTEEYGTVDSYGIAFTPLFLCIGLWVGALMTYVVFYYDQKHRFGIFGSDNKKHIIQNVLYIAIGLVEGIITGALLKLGLGYEVQNIVLYYFASALIGVTFMSIIQFLIKNFGDVGKFLALVILVLQLAASGGTFPIETIDKAFQNITPYLPMTYAIKLLKEILVPTASDFKGQYIAILIGISFAILAIMFILDVIRLKQKNNEASN